MKHPLTLALEATSAFLSLFPESWIVAWARLLGAFWWHVLRYRRRTILENIERAFPELSKAEQKKLGREATTHLVRTLFEFFRIPLFQRRGFEGYARAEGLENFNAAKAENKGVLVLAAHTGNFELAVAAFAHACSPLSVVVKPFPKAVDAFINRVRATAGFSLITPKGAVRPILARLKRNEAVVLVLDQNATRSIGVFVDFFGKPASTMTALAAIAARTRSPVVAAIPYRDDDGTHVLKMHPAIPWEEKETREKTIAHMTQVYTRLIEDAIRAHPPQWFWTHKRWRTQPVP